MSGITSVSVRKRRRRLAGRPRRLMTGVLAAIGLLALIPVIGLAVHDNGTFELDGNIKHDSLTTPPYDWASLFNSSGNRIITPPSGPLLADDFLPDFVTPDSTYFSSNGAGVKDIDAISNWGCTTIHNPTAKDNLLNAYAALVQVQSGATAGHFVLYVGSERESNNGTSFAGFWLFKNSVTCNPLTGTFSGSHTDGDILVVSNYTNGGGNQEVELFQEQSGVLTPVANGGVCGSTPNDPMCGIANGATLPAADVPWPPGNASGLQSNTFVEAGIDLTALLGGNVPCFAFYQAETRSSAQLTATLKDFTGGSFNSCVPPTITTSQNSSGGSLNVEVNTGVTDVATISGASGTPGGTMTYNLYTGTSCDVNGKPIGPLVQSNTVNVTSAGAQPPSSTFTPTTAGTWQWIAVYSGDLPNGRNPAASSACGSEPLRAVDASITITPTATNEINHAHTFTISVTAFPSGTGTPSITITPNVSPPPGSSSNTCGTTSGTSATCMLTINSGTTGTFTANATANVTMGGVTVTRSTSGNSGPGGSGPATKTYVDAYIQLSPLTKQNLVGTNHTITASVFEDPGTGAVLAGNVLVTFSIQSGPGSFVSGNTCITSNVAGPGFGTCTIQITSMNAGTTVVRATISVTVSGVPLTRTTNDNVSKDSVDAQKIWLPRTPTLTTTVLLGDTVTVSGLNVTGTVDFTLFGPGANACSSGSPILSSFTNIALVNGVASTPQTTPVTVAGVYSWQVTYHSGDQTRNTDATTTCTSEVVNITYSPGQTPPPNP